ncbi:outer membrane lipoprotein carrier protein LolA [Balneola sp. MJW-20]|uniref:LolA family protein n=1 Tax=Gracilimonas aurantiaca TaxID=3234185 RepID=UPI0034660F82
MKKNYRKSSTDWMVFKKTFLLSLFLLCMASLQLSAQSPTLEKLKQKFESGQVFTSDFDQSETVDYTGETNYTSGVIWISNNAYKVELDLRTVAVDGETTRTYEEDRNRLIISPYDPAETEFAPSRLLEGSEDLYNATEREVSEGTAVTLESVDEFSESRSIEIILDFELRPVRIRRVDFSDNVTVIEFNSGRFIDRRDEIFSISIPDDAEIIDLRE